MRRAGKIIGWILAFSASFAVGAVIAAHSDPFPPGVTDPGATVTPPTSPTPDTQREFTGRLRFQTTHTLYVGGACRTNWNGSLSLREDTNGKLTGTGAFDLLGKLNCDFAVIQAQSKTLNVTVAGSVKGNRVNLILTAGSTDPKASSDFGGLSHTLHFLGLSTPLDHTQRVHALRSDGDRGTYAATGTFTVACSSAC